MKIQSASQDHEPATSVALEGPLTVTFTQAGDFTAYHAAKDWLAARGYSLGHMQRGAPCGILRGDYDIQKWRNLRPDDRVALDGTLQGDFRNGPLTIRLVRDASPSSAKPADGDSSRDAK